MFGQPLPRVKTQDVIPVKLIVEETAGPWTVSIIKKDKDTLQLYEDDEYIKKVTHPNVITRADL
jgi:hypothetical protein